jgi:hypothetical protein
MKEKSVIYVYFPIYSIILYSMWQSGGEEHPQ